MIYAELKLSFMLSKFCLFTLEKISAQKVRILDYYRMAINTTHYLMLSILFLTLDTIIGFDNDEYINSIICFVKITMESSFS